MTRILFSIIVIVLLSEFTRDLTLAIPVLITTAIFIRARHVGRFEIGLVLFVLASYGLILVIVFERNEVTKRPVIFIFVLSVANFIMLYYDSNFGAYHIYGLIGLVGILSPIYWNSATKGIRSWKPFLGSLVIILFLNFVVLVAGQLDVGDLYLLSERIGLDNDFEGINKTGTFGSSELLGEFSLISFVLIFKSVTKLSFTRLERLFFSLGGLVALILCVSSFSRTIVFLLAFFLLIEFRKVIFTPIIAVGGSVLFLIFLSTEYSFFLIEKIDSGRFLSAIIRNPFTGEGTSREVVFEIALVKISSRSFLFGDGFSTQEYNKEVWLGGSSDRWADYHNGYYSIIPTFGWIALVIFCSFLIYLIIKSFQSSFVLADAIRYSVIFFIISQWKINFLRTGSYFFMVIWFLSFFYYVFKYESLKKNTGSFVTSNRP